MGLLRTLGVGTAGCGVDSTPVTWNIFKSYFAFQDHAERCHGWRIGGMRSFVVLCETGRGVVL